ncbi:NAC domain-containing protein 41 [Hirschfeldia incana]|nr:NAC domain-containing protein 41 [Hirschfeldia incana]
MEKLSSTKKSRGLKLPPGFRFHPTDEELVAQYLHRKVTGLPLPASVIPEIDICKADPWDLPGDCESERYFFSTREAKYPNGNRSNRSTGSGYWKATGIDKQIGGKKLVGMKKTLVFYKGKPPNGTRTNWVLHEYRLLDLQQESNGENANWVLCRVFLKKTSNANSNKRKEDEKERKEEKESDEDDNKSACPIFYDFLRKDKKKKRCCDLNVTPTCCCCSASASSSVCSSALTQTSAHNDSDYHEEITCREIKFCLFL